MEFKTTITGEKIRNCTKLINKYKWVISLVLLVFAATAFIELGMGRLFLGPDGRFDLWEGNIWSSEQSQRFADPYSFSHIIHGMLFYGILVCIRL